MTRAHTIKVRHPVLGEWVFRWDGEAADAVLARPDAGWGGLEPRLRGGGAQLSEWAPLADHRSVPSDATLLSFAVDADDFELVAALLEAGADPNVGALGERSGSALLSRANSSLVATALVTAGADLSPSEEDGSTPLHFAREPAVVRLLLEAGCDPLHQNHAGLTPLALADSGMVPRETFQMLRTAAMARVRELPGRGVIFERSRKATKDHGASFARRRLRASSDLHWTILGVAGVLDEVVDQLASVLSARAVERDVAARSVVARDGCFVFKPAGSDLVVAFVDSDDPRSGLPRRQRNMGHAVALSRASGRPVFLFRDMCLDEVNGEDVRRVGANDDGDPRFESKPDAEIAADFDAACASRGIIVPDMTAEEDGLRQWLRVRGWKAEELGPVHFIVTVA